MIEPQAAWPDVFKSGSIEGKSDKELVSIGLMAWGLCMSGNTLPESFGRVMSKIAGKIGVPATPIELGKCADRIALTKGRDGD